MSDRAQIMIVEDDADIVEAMRIILEGAGYQVEEVHNSQDAVEKLKSYRPDLIILDVMMRTPDEGFQFSYKLKNDPQYSSIPILIITSVAQKTGFSFSPETDAEYLPVEALVEKPVKPKELLAWVSKLLGKD